ncbi:MAG: hypothetical protein CR982_05660 [Candidatus Cloacimonadota bacterium]|nr:MAG: hypothetical protein CR982_05660 [Candidatus Cloacimonadota bacterium]PIE81392.1 MAG: hypothetical protein CSA15_00710 [Candidatus Delongbacteria bacterium]
MRNILILLIAINSLFGVYELGDSVDIDLQFDAYKVSGDIESINYDEITASGENLMILFCNSEEDLSYNISLSFNDSIYPVFNKSPKNIRMVSYVKNINTPEDLNGEGWRDKTDDRLDFLLSIDPNLGSIFSSFSEDQNYPLFIIISSEKKLIYKEYLENFDGVKYNVFDSLGFLGVSSFNVINDFGINRIRLEWEPPQNSGKKYLVTRRGDITAFKTVYNYRSNLKGYKIYLYDEQTDEYKIKATINKPDSTVYILNQTPIISSEYKFKITSYYNVYENIESRGIYRSTKWINTQPSWQQYGSNYSVDNAVGCGYHDWKYGIILHNDSLYVKVEKIETLAKYGESSLEWRVTKLKNDSIYYPGVYGDLQGSFDSFSMGDTALVDIESDFLIPPDSSYAVVISSSANYVARDVNANDPNDHLYGNLILENYLPNNPNPNYDETLEWKHLNEIESSWVGTFYVRVFIAPMLSSIDENLLSSVNLISNYPNPFNPSTTINLDLEKDLNISLDIYNNFGQKVTSLYKGELNRGTHSFNFDGKSLATGTYFSVVRSKGETIAVNRMVLIK